MLSSIRSRGFTLIELLVVVAIVALLMSILLPSLSRARQQARQTACLANVRSWGMGMHLYVTESGGFTNDGGNLSGYPDINSDKAKEFYWINVIPRRLNSPAYYELAEANTLPFPGAKFGGLYVCPEDPKRPGDADGTTNATGAGNVIPYNAANGLKFYIDYIYCSKFTGSNNRPPKITEIQNPAQTVLIFERRSSNDSSELPLPSSVTQTKGTMGGTVSYDETVYNSYKNAALGVYRGAYNIVTARHRMGSNVAFCDGSARWVSFGDLQTLDPNKPVGSTSIENHNTETLIWAPLR